MLLRAGVTCARPLAVRGGAGQDPPPAPGLSFCTSSPHPHCHLTHFQGWGWDGHVLALAQMVPVSPPEGWWSLFPAPEVRWWWW